MAMPARHRERLLAEYQGKMVATIDTKSRCLLIYPLEIWEQKEEQIENLPAMNPVTRRFQRLVLGHATDLEFDGSGRVLFPPSLRDYAALDKKVVLVGQGKKFELWSEENWAAECNQAIEEANNPALSMPEEMLSITL